ncbi:uncharacterized protein M421DRAFT_424644 [Didymella exigua CBS 183.55]|uniref:Uncharacterized protein n=1 Tax=Didymella exigua CBS 183.55 TaxID=1150837 RepID=A0A6A5R8H6_9PLEO|nr:uncharacterized protein M421DRAFT_424644 [Didymella exigua CBS 183.55]KAF1924511.1 hypothetical protein M421DRAFT_424644 [Didymella exigua CBS 183.55]
MSLSSSQGFIEPHASSSEADIDSLPSSSTNSSVDEDEYVSDAEREWRESLQQMELLLTMVMVPYIGKYFGRKLAYYSWAKFMEWKYPVEVVITNKTAFKAAGAIEAAATL